MKKLLLAFTFALSLTACSQAKAQDAAAVCAPATAVIQELAKQNFELIWIANPADNDPESKVVQNMAIFANDQNRWILTNIITLRNPPKSEPQEDEHGHKKVSFSGKICKLAEGTGSTFATPLPNDKPPVEKTPS